MRKLFHFLLTTIPRPVLIILSYPYRAFARLWYAGNKYTCPIEGKSYRKFLPYGALNIRENALCPGSLSLERHRLLWLYLKEKTNFFTAPKLKMLHVAPEQCFLDIFKKQKNLDYTTGDLVSPIADVKMDLHNPPFDDNTFDVVFCNHVLEHVDDADKCMRELYRIIKPGGWGIFQVPLDTTREETLEDPSITSEEDRLKHYWQKDHVRLFGMDYPKRLEAAGFDVKTEDYTKEIGPELTEKYCLMKGELLFFCSK
ncbi:class I SAM-dependent methyltransferase [Luteibaculum oceani]|uniref:Methyltransferase domain-containing protein n=1 Tax=Luteibaculum oceani TaxID=1294296 RepID=A0A5C6V565_9FLAO|nr:methyltransferase domain-containing protein [Luteibaculum oceani]TXC78968.1 methyltransferase domain-containing protein [Luteibaculum oceani]